MGKNHYYCKIEDTVYNFEEVQKLLKQNRQWDATAKIVELMGCEHRTASSIAKLIADNNMEIPPKIYLTKEPIPKKQKQQQTTQYQVKCPFCGSPDVRKITQFNRAMGSLFFGFNSPNHGKQWNCRNCDSFF